MHGWLPKRHFTRLPVPTNRPTDTQRHLISLECWSHFPPAAAAQGRYRGSREGVGSGRRNPIAEPPSTLVDTKALSVACQAKVGRGRKCDSVLDEALIMYCCWSDGWVEVGSARRSLDYNPLGCLCRVIWSRIMLQILIAIHWNHVQFKGLLILRTISQHQGTIIV